MIVMTISGFQHSKRNKKDVGVKVTLGLLGNGTAGIAGRALSVFHMVSVCLVFVPMLWNTSSVPPIEARTQHICSSQQ
jgi:hypothetical protein